MPVNTIYALGASQISVSGGAQLSGITQGDGSHLDGLFITLNSNAWEAIEIDDNETSFDDNDTGQRLEGAQSFDGTSYADNLRVEAEFSLVLRDPDGNTYTVLAFNINEGGGGASYATIEGLAFVGGVGGFPPRDVPLEVLSSGEGPTQQISTLATPPCFTPGTRIATPGGLRLIEELQPGDLVATMDNGAQPIRWIGRTRLPGAVLARTPDFRAIVVARGALGPGAPDRDMRLSPQHRVLLADWRAEYFFGEPEILVPVRKLVNGTTVRVDDTPGDVTYLHLLFDRHEILWSDGLPSESYLPQSGDERAPGTRDEILRLFPQLDRRAGHAMPARRCVSDKRAVVLRPPPSSRAAA